MEGCARPACKQVAEPAGKGTQGIDSSGLSGAGPGGAWAGLGSRWLCHSLAALESTTMVLTMVPQKPGGERFGGMGRTDVSCSRTMPPMGTSGQQSPSLCLNSFSLSLMFLLLCFSVSLSIFPVCLYPLYLSICLSVSVTTCDSIFSITIFVSLCASISLSLPLSLSSCMSLSLCVPASHT